MGRWIWNELYGYKYYVYDDEELNTKDIPGSATVVVRKSEKPKTETPMNKGQNAVD